MGPPWLYLLHYNLQEERERIAGEQPRCGKEGQLLPWDVHCLKPTPRGSFVPTVSVFTSLTFQCTCSILTFAQDGQNAER